MSQQKKQLHRQKKRHPRQLPDAEGQAMSRFQHPAHPYPLISAPINPKIPRAERPRWQCNLCKYEWTPDGDQRARYVSQQPAEDFNVCKDCLGAPWSAWNSQKHIFARGEDLVVIKIMSLGMIPIRQGWPSPDDHHGFLALLDEERREGNLPWVPREAREIHISASHVKIAAETYQNDGWERSEIHFFQELPLDTISKVTYIDDAPYHFVVLFCGEFPSGECHVLVSDTREKAVALVEALEHAFQFVYEQAIICDLNDNIDAGLEGRPTAIQQQAEFLKMQQQTPAPSPSPRQLSPVGHAHVSQRSVASTNRLSIFNVFANQQPLK